MTRMFLARHGRTAWHDSGRYMGSTDVELDGAGRAQALLLAEWAARAGVTRVVSSPLRRAVQTGSAVAERLGVPLATDAGLAELDFGIAEGRSLEELRTLAPDAARRFEADPVAGHLPRGEDPGRAARRGAAAVAGVAAGGGVPLAVAHNTLLRLLVCAWLGIPLADYRRRLPGLDPCAVTEIEVEDGTVRLRRYNCPPQCGEDR